MTSTQQIKALELAKAILENDKDPRREQLLKMVAESIYDELKERATR